jgi:hypothetical protein
MRIKLPVAKRSVNGIPLADSGGIVSFGERPLRGEPTA